VTAAAEITDISNQYEKVANKELQNLQHICPRIWCPKMLLRIKLRSKSVQHQSHNRHYHIGQKNIVKSCATYREGVSDFFFQIAVMVLKQMEKIQDPYLIIIFSSFLYIR
jgi:hypothetical protein